ncbi:MAG: hypothetical protein LBF37_02690 [Rickettsiales bacterium]|nr:hypothetical protein [Rickettsiales bacterium]
MVDYKRQEMNFLGKLVFFLSANSPVFIIWGIFQMEKHPLLSPVLFIIAVLALGALALLFLYAGGKQEKTLYEVNIIENVNSKMIEYMFSYVLPFLSINNNDSWNSTIALGIYYIVLFGVYMRGDVFYINPILNLFGYNIYKISYKVDGNQEQGFIVCKEKKYKIKNTCNISAIDNNLFLFKKGL